jgi:hypothetical protein
MNSVSKSERIQDVLVLLMLIGRILDSYAGITLAKVKATKEWNSSTIAVLGHVSIAREPARVYFWFLQQFSGVTRESLVLAEKALHSMKLTFPPSKMFKASTTYCLLHRQNMEWSKNWQNNLVTVIIGRWCNSYQE